jgi:sterol-4alpha-carboxylate 3-dehydrogenase (decarboxylating)
MGNVLVVGGSGFLGSALVNRLAERGERVRVLDTHASPDPRVESMVGDLRDPTAVERACAEVETVFQTASLVDWGPRKRQLLYDVNVIGNQNVIAACQRSGVKRLIYTSSIDVVFDGQPIVNGDESLPYPIEQLDDYGHTKALAEQDVIRANGQQGLATCSLRTAGIYGPGDRYRLPSILREAQRGRMVRLGDGHAKFNHVYVTNVAHAHVLAAESLTLDSPLAGQCYFITDHPASNFYDFFEPYLQALGYSTKLRRVSYALARMLAVFSELFARSGGKPPLLTRYVVASTCRDFSFTHAKATRDFGYAPIVSFEQAQAETIAWLWQSGWAHSDAALVVS